MTPNQAMQLAGVSQKFQAKFYSRSHDAVIRVYDEPDNGIETHKRAGEFEEV